MKILFDHGTPRSIARSLAEHQVTRAAQMGWQELENGVLIQNAEEAGFDLFLSTDRNIRYQQNLKHRKMAIVVLTDQQWPNVKLHLDNISRAVNAAQPGSFAEVEIPLAAKKPFTRT